MNKILIIIAFTFAGCLNQPSLQNTETNALPPRDTNINLEKAKFAMRNYQQIIANYSALTGVPAGLKVIRVETERIKASLPINHQSTSFTPFNQIAITSLALIYCEEWIKNNTTDGGSQTTMKIFGVTKNGNTNLYKDQIISQFYSRLASTDEENDSFLSEGRPMIRDAMNTVGSILPASNYQNEVILGCGLFLGSLYFVADGD